MKNRLPTRLVCFFLILTLLPVSCLRSVSRAAAEEMPVPLSLVNQSILSTVVVTEELSIEGSCTCSDSAVIRVSDGASLLVREGAILYGDIYLSGENAILDITGTVQGNVYVTASSANVFVSGTVTGKMVLDPSASPDAAQVQVNTTTTSRIHDLSVRTGGQLWIEGHVDSLTIEAENQAMVILHNPSYFEETFPDRERFWTHGHADKAYVYGAGLQLMWSSIDTLYSFGPNNTFDGSVLAHFDCHLGKVFMYGGWVQISEGSTADEVYVLGNDTDLYIGQGFDAGLPSSEHISSVRKVTSIGKKAGIRIEGYVDELVMHEGRLEMSGSVKSARLEKVDVNQTNPFGLNEGKRSLRHYLPDYAFHELVARDCSMSFSADQIQVDLAILENCHVQTGGTWDTLAVSGSGIRAMETEEANLAFRVHNLISWGDSSQVSLGYGSQVDTAYGQNAYFSYGEPAERVRSAAKNGRSIGRNSRTSPLEMPEGEVLWSRKTNTDYFTVDVPENALLTLGIESPEVPQFLLLDLPEQETIVIRGDLAEPVSTLVTVPGQAQIRLVGAPGDVTTLCEVRPSAAIELQTTVRKADESGKGEQEAVTPDSLVLSAVNLTTGQPLPAPSVAQDTLFWLPSDVRPGDEVSLEITDRDGLCAPATVRVRTDGDNRSVVKASLVQRGGFSAMIPDDTRLHAYLYDAQGRYLTEVMLKNGVYARQGMEDGEYQLLLIRGSIGQWQVADLSQLDMFGLAEGQDYLRLPLDIRTGVMLSMSPQVPPQPEAHSEYFSGDTRLSCRSGVATQKALVLVQLDYQAVRELQDMKARLVLTGDSGSVVPESLTVNGTVLESSRDGQDVMIPLPGASGKLQFYVRTESVGELALSCILSGTDQGETVYTYAGTVNLSVADLSLTAPSMISGRILHLTGNGLPGSTVEILKDGQVAVQTLCPASGQWNTQVSLDTYGAYDIQARLVLPDGQTLTSDTRTVWRAVGAPSLASITVYYMEHGVQRSVELSGFLLDSGKLRFSYEPGTEFIFAIHAENADLIDTMTVQCEGNGASTPLACTYQATTGEWIARGRISDDDYFVPRSIQVSYTVNDDPREPSETILPTLGLRDLTPSVDLDIGSLRLVRSYPVHAGLHTVQGMFGPGWMTNLDIRAAHLEEDGKEAILIITAGAFRFFEKSESGRFQEMGGSASMTLSQAGMTLEEASGGRLVFDAAGRLMQHTNADGTGWKYTYDTAGQLITVTDHMNQTMELTWCEGHVVEARCGEEHILYHYMQGYLAAVQRDDDTEVYAYSGDLEIPGRHSLATVMGSGGMVQLEYDEFGRITRYRTADEDETLEYPDEYTVRMTSLTGNVEEFHYSDENMLLLSHTTASGTTNYTYDAMYRLAQTEKNGFVTSYTYDSENRLIASESRLSRYELSYDKNGNLASSRLGGEGAISYTWNSDGKCTGITYQDGTREQFEYTKEGRLQKFTSRDGQQTQYRYLADGTLQEIIRPDGHTSYEWNDDRQGVNIEENGTYTYVAYDQEGRVSSVSYPDHYAVSVEYAEEDRLGKVGFGKEPLPEEWEEYQAKVDAAEASLQTLTDVWEALCADETSTEEEQAEAFSQVQAAEAELRQIQEHPPETDWLYQLVYEYDGNGLLTGVTAEELGSIAEIERIDKDDFMLRQIRYANGATASRLYEAGMTVLTGVTSPDGQVLDQQMPMYDAAGRIAATFSDRDTAAYLYDEEGRLAYEAHGKSSVLVDYDMSGNRVALQEEEVNIPVTVNELGQVTAKGDIRYSYDQAGRRISSTGPDGTEEYLWNSRDQLTGIRGKRNLDFTYDVFGMLSGITEGNRTTRLYTLPAGYNFTLAEIDSEENLFCHVWTEYGLLATLNGQDTSYYGFNVHGDICTVLDESGEVIQRNVFDASGNPIRDSADVDGYSYRGGSGIRSLGGIYNMRARWYDPGTMTFLSPDSAKTTYDLNLYRYANQDPVNYVDLTGFAYIQDPITGITYDIEIHKYKHQNPFEMTPEEYEKSVKEIEQMLKDLEDWKNWEKWKEWQEQQEENGKDEGKDYSKEIDPDEIPTVIIDPIPSPGTLPPLIFVPPEDTERPNVLPQPLPEPKDPGIEIFPLPGPRKPEIEIFPAPQPQFPNYIPDYVQPIPGGGGRMDVRQPFRLIDQDWWINLNEYSYEHPVLFRFEVGTGVVLVGLVFVYGGPLLTDIGQLIGFLLASLPKFAYAAVKYVLPAFLIFRPIFADASIDPSGYVYEAVRDNRLEGVKTTVFYRDDQGNAVFWDAEEYDQANPQISDEEGLYGWYVPEGLWKVTYQKEGYKDTESEWLPVPPPQTEVNIGMESTETPAIEYAALYDDGIEIVFTRYMQTDTVNLSSLDLQGAEPVQVIPLDEAQDDLGKSVARKYMLIYRGNPTRCVLSVNENAMSYTGIPCGAESRSLALVSRTSGAELNVVRLTVGETREIRVGLLCNGNASGHTLQATSVTPSLLQIVQEKGQDGTGNALLTVQALRPGTAFIHVTDETTGFETDLRITIDF